MFNLSRCVLTFVAALALIACRNGGYDAPPVTNYGALSFSSAAFSVTEGTASTTITVNRTGGSTGAVTVNYATGGGTATAAADYTAASGILSWAAGDATSKTFTVTITDDSAVEPAETVNLALSSATGGATLGTSAAALTIADNDSTVAFSAAAFSVGEAGSSAAISVTRSAGAGASLPAASVSFATSNGSATAGSDYTATATTVNWVAGDAAAKTVNIPVANDTIVEGSETVNLALTSPTGAVLGAQTTAVLTITDDDVVTMSGVAATGAPLAGATVTLKDANGAVRTATTNASGQYSLDTTALMPPFILRVVSGGITLFSEGLVAGSSGSPATVNTHPYTNLLMQVYYQGQGLSAATVFNTAGAPSAVPSAEALRNIANIVAGIIQPVLNQAGVDTATFNLITTTFTANGASFDGVLDDTVFNSNGLDFTVNNGTVTQTVDVNVDADGNSTPGDISLNSTTTDNTSQESSQSSQQTTVATAAQQSDFDAAIAGVRTTFSNIASTAAQRGANLTASDMLPFIDAQFLDEGQDRNGLAGDLAGFFTQQVPAGATVTVDDVSVRNFTEAGTADLVSAVIRIRVTPQQGNAFTQELGGAEDGNHGIVFKRQNNGAFLFFGDQTIIRIRVRVQFVRNYDNASGPGTLTDRKRMQVQSSVVAGSISSIVVNSTQGQLPLNCTGGADVNDPNYNTERPLGATSLTLGKRNGTFNGEERFDLPCAFGFPALTAYPPAGSQYSFSVTPTGSSAVAQASVLNASTTEVVDIHTINGVTREQFRQANTAATVRGTSVTVSWTMPGTLNVSGVELRGFVQSANQQTNGGGSDIDGPQLSAGAITGSISIPANSNDGNPATNVNISVVYTGSNGEQTSATVLYQ